MARIVLNDDQDPIGEDGKAKKDSVQRVGFGRADTTAVRHVLPTKGAGTAEGHAGRSLTPPAGSGQTHKVVAHDPIHTSQENRRATNKLRRQLARQEREADMSLFHEAEPEDPYANYVDQGGDDE